MSLAFSSSLRSVAEKSKREKDRNVTATEELLADALNTNDFEVAFLVEINLKKVIEQYEQDAEVSKRGRGLLQRMRRCGVANSYTPHRSQSSTA